MYTEHVAVATPFQSPTKFVDRLLSRQEVEQRTSLSRSTLYQQMSEGIFPKHIPLGLRRVGWLESEIDRWIADRIHAARATKLSAQGAP